MKKIVLSLIFCLLCVSCSSNIQKLQEEQENQDVQDVQVSGVDIVAFGYDTGGSFLQTDRVLANFGVSFGFIFIPKGSPDFAPVDLTLKISRPSLKNPTIPHERTIKKKFYIGRESVFSFKINYKWELVPGKWTFQIFHDNQKLAEKTFTVLLSDSVEQCAKVFEQLTFFEVQGCGAYEIDYKPQKAYIVTVLYGPGMDCPSGCIYQHGYAILLETGFAYRVKNSEFIDSLEKIAREIEKKLNLRIDRRKLGQFTKRELIKDGDRYGIKHTFNSYVGGEIIIYDNGQAQDSNGLIIKMLSIEQAEQVAIQELKKLGYINNPETKIQFQETREYPKIGWLFSLEGYDVEVFTDGTIHISHQGNTLYASKVYGTQEIDLVRTSRFARWFAESELEKIGKTKRGSISSICQNMSYDDDTCRKLSCGRSFPTHTDKYDVKIWKDGNIKIYRDRELIHQTKISPDNIDYNNTFDLIQKELNKIGIVFDDWSGYSSYEKDYKLTQLKLYETRKEEYIVKVCKNGMIEIFENDVLIHQRNIFE